jgi:uncharacterized protein (DUF2342 family)
VLLRVVEVLMLGLELRLQSLKEALALYERIVQHAERRVTCVV